MSPSIKKDEVKKDEVKKVPECIGYYSCDYPSDCEFESECDSKFNGKE